MVIRAYFPSQFSSLFLLFLPHPGRICLPPFSWLWFYQTSSDSEKIRRNGACLHEKERKARGTTHRKSEIMSKMQNTNCFYPSWLANKAKQHQHALECFVRYMLLKSLVFSVSWFCNKNCWYWQNCIIVLSKKKQFGLLFPETVFSYKNNIVV